MSTPLLTITSPDDAKIAYDKNEGRSPGIVFLHGLKSDRKGTKAEAIMAYCQETHRAFLSIDMFGHGDSSGDFAEGCITRWTDDVTLALDELTEGPQILVGSSMGGWVMLRAALARPDRIKGMVGIAAAPDFTEDLIWNTLSADQKHEMKTQGFLEQPSDYGEDPYPISLGLIEDGRNCLLMREKIPINVPTHLLHGQRDADVPFSTSLALAKNLTSSDVEITLVKDGDHRLSRPQDLDRLAVTLDRLCLRLEGDA